jgi:hypothetical protein
MGIHSSYTKISYYDRAMGIRKIPHTTVIILDLPHGKYSLLLSLVIIGFHTLPSIRYIVITGNHTSPFPWCVQQSTQSAGPVLFLIFC